MNLLQEILLEAPYWHKGLKDKKFDHEMSITSLSSVKRLHRILKKDKLTYYLINNAESVAGVWKETVSDIPPTDDHDVKFISILVLRFKKHTTLVNIPDDLKDKKILQVDYVETNTNFENLGFAKELYVQLAKVGYAVMSDTAQYDGGKELWKSIARNAIKSGITVKLLDDEHGYLRDKSGNPLIYNGKNLDDKEIWSHDFDFTKEHILLVME
jgi:hypothetical protein